MITPAIILMRPSTLIWALVAGVVVVLYLRTIRPPQVAVARPSLWREVLGEPRSSASVWRRQRLVSAAIHVGIVLLLALAAADPCLRRPRTVVFVVDNSQSMEAVEGDASRIAVARKLLTQHLKTIGPREYGAIVTTADQPVVVSPAEWDMKRVGNAIERIRSADLPSRMIEAIDVAAELAARGTHLQIHVISDGCFGGADELVLSPDIVLHPVGNATGNATITRLAVRRYPNDTRRFQVLAEVTNGSDVALTAPVHVQLGAKPIHEWECQVDANSTATVMADLESEKGGLLVAILDKDDAIADDNRLETTLPTATAKSSEPFPASQLSAQATCKTQSPEAWCAKPSAPDRYGVHPLWPWLVLIAIVLLAAEWALYHRRWTC